MLVDIDAQGKVTKVTVTKPVGQGFDEAARDAVMQYVFSPAEVDGKPSPIRIEYTLHFVPKTAPPESPDGGVADAAAEAPPPPPPPPPAILVATGRLREKGTRDPLPGAEVAVVERSADGVEKPAVVIGGTDAEGRFEVKGQPGLGLRVIVTEPRHEPCIRDLAADEVRADKRKELDCLVPKSGAPSYETTVRAKKPAPAVTRYELAQPELKVVPGTFGDPLRVVQNLPGVARSPFGLGALVIRGASPNDSGIYVEGHRIPLLYHFLIGPGVLAPELIDRIDFFPGNFGVNYGRVTAGVVDVGIRTNPAPRLHGMVDINLLHSAAYVEGPLGGGWTGSVSARRSYIDLLLPLVLPSNVTTVAPNYWDYQAGVNRNIAGGKLSLFAFGSNDSLKVISSDPRQGNVDLGLEMGFHKVFAVWTQALGNWTNKLSPASATNACASASASSRSTGRPTSRAARRPDPAARLALHAAHRPRRRGALGFDLLQHPARPRRAPLRHRRPRDPAADHPARHADDRPLRGRDLGRRPRRHGHSGRARRLLPLRRAEPVHVRSAPGRALEDERRPHLEGGRRHLPPDGRAAAPEPSARQPGPAADLGGPVLGRVPAHAAREADAGHDAVLRAPARSAGAAGAVQAGRGGAVLRR
jgi:TonB family protein